MERHKTEGVEGWSKGREKERLEKDGIDILETHFLGDSSKSFWERIFRDRISLNKLKKEKKRKEKWKIERGVGISAALKFLEGRCSSVGWDRVEGDCPKSAKHSNHRVPETTEGTVPNYKSVKLHFEHIMCFIDE
ncbi:hypothetical protein CEXT_746191 [Caerostris extrusa]|uniref:Uncharacterized protein n=1 Tax=Caerostris extrusa TaxID=172846 RepID=A0AAV4T0G0_CAEEX|nr:hypothetical protein CEXT_746191 [Caerostris extrusa]